MNKIFIASVATAAGLGGAVGILATRTITHPVPHPTVSEVSPPDGETSQLVSALERRIEALEGRPATVRAPEGLPAPSRVETVATRPPAPSRPPMTPADMDKLVETEARDVSWAPKYEHDVTASLASEFKDTHVREATCGTSLCRVVVDHDSPADEGQFLSRFWAVLPGGLAGGRYEREVDASGTPRTVLHLVRKGYEDVL